MTAMEQPIKITTLTLQLTQHFYNLTDTIASNVEMANTSPKSQKIPTQRRCHDTERRAAVAAAGGEAARADNSVPHVYSFALTCNFSRIDNAVLNLEHDDGTCIRCNFSRIDNAVLNLEHALDRKVNLNGHH